MPTKQIVFALITFLHSLFTAVWVGGLITLGLSVMPSARKVLGKGPQMKQLMDTIQKRLSWLVYGSIVGLALTGLLLSNRTAAFQGLFSFANRYSAVLAVKHLLMLLMVAVALYRSLVLGRRQSQSPAREKLSAGLLFLNMALGIGVLLLSGFSAALAASPPV
ncbi:MAG: CopD family protein [Chloroflexota bacterium]